MAKTITNNLNCSSNGSAIEALKKHITTCLQRWQKKHSTKSQEEKSDHHSQDTTTQGENCCFKFQHNSSRRFLNGYYCKECSFVQRTTIYCKSFNKKFQNYINHSLCNPNSTIFNKTEGPRQYGRKVEIIAKLLSSTLIAKAKPSSDTEERDGFFEEELEIIQRSISTSTSNLHEGEMTITDLSFMDLRQEYPDLNSEIRSILTARAQEGATISEIREDYRKLTGLSFPIYEDVTEFLLTIPHVTAYCTEQGTRIFNIMPMDKTKHIHDMVLGQKSQPEVFQRPTSNRNYYRERERNNNYQPLNWRQNTNHKLLENNVNFYQEPLNIGEPEQQEQLVPSTESNLSREGSDRSTANKCFYQDNCNYLINRICNQRQPEPLQFHLMENTSQITSKPAILPASNIETPTPSNNFHNDIPSYSNNVNNLNNLCQVQHQQQPHYQQNTSYIRNVESRRSFLNPSRQLMPISSRSSSATTKSWYTNESAFTDSDYEAHLLDFLLLGDDFFLYMARMELRCKFKKNQRILQSGLCVSGQTIGASIKRIRAMDEQRRSIILNIGSVDIMQGRQLIQIEHDFRELITAMLKKGIKPIITTLAPLANYSHNYEVKRMVERFNTFIKKECKERNLVVIDIWSCLVNDKKHVLFDCYQNEPRNVTGTSESYLFWNKIGRQRVLQLIESKLEY